MCYNRFSLLIIQNFFRIYLVFGSAAVLRG